jgi:hypothetical protein
MLNASTILEGFAMKRSILSVSVVMVLVALASLAAGTQLQAQEPMPQIAGSVWEGTENRDGTPGRLILGFHISGKVLICDRISNPNDAKTFILGTWTQNGNEVEIRLRDAVYRGRINGRIFSGNAEFTVGPQQAWAFTVIFVPAPNRTSR